MRNPSKGWKALGKINTKKSEAGAHKVFRDYGQSLEVKISRINLDSKQNFPYVRFGDWMKYIVSNDDLDCLVGVKDVKLMQKVLTVFWDRYQAVHPTHPIYGMASRGELCLSKTIPTLLHGDEGRGQKKKQILILSSHGALGRSTQKAEKLVESNGEQDNPLCLNFRGNTMKTHFLHAAMPICLYNETPSSFNQMLQVIADEFHELLTQGIEIQGKKFWVCCLGCKGDAPFLMKSGSFERSYTRRPTRKASKKAASGICHLCLAGKEDHDFPVPFEQIGSIQPAWLSTVAAVKPFQSPSPLLKIPFDVRDGYESSFWHFDIFHNFHLGVGKAFISSAVTIIMEVIPGTIGGTFQLLTDDFRDYCQKVRETPYHRKLSASLFGVEQSFQDFPEAAWSKGDFTRLVHQWFEDFCRREIVGIVADPLCILCVPRIHAYTYF